MEEVESPKVCGCEDTSCPHETDATSSVTENHEELALAFLVALTPLAVFTLLGQIGLL